MHARNDKLTERVRSEPTPAVPRRRRYSLGDVLEHTDVVRARLMRWLEVDIITTGGGGTQGVRREFSFRNLVEVKVCDDLRGLRFHEEVLLKAVQYLRVMWEQPDAPLDPRTPDGPTYRDAIGIWITFQRCLHPTISGELLEWIRADPFTADQVVSRVIEGNPADLGIAFSGTVIPVRRIIQDLEQRTGDRFA